MPRNASGVYTLPASNPVVPLTVITSQWANTTMSDLAEAMTQSIAANGVTSPTANLPMAGFRHTGVGLATQYNHYARGDQVQQAYFAKATDVAANPGQTAYTCNLPFGSGGITALVHQQPMTFTPNVVNLGPASISVNGGAFAPIVNPDNTAIGANRLLANTPVAMMWNAYTSAWTLIGYYSTAVNTLTSADAQMLTASPPTGNTVLTPIVNVANGMVKLDGNAKVPAGLLPAGGAILLGTWNAAPGTLPANGTISGQYYIVTTPGTLNLYVSSGATWIQTPTAVLSGDELLWQQVAGQPTGWYYVKKSAATTGAAVTLTPTPSFPAAATVQAWVNAADAASGFLLTNGTRPMTGDLFAPSLIASQHNWNMYNSAGWKFVAGAGTWGGLRHMITGAGPYAIVDYVASAASTGAGTAVPLYDLCYWGATASYIRSPWGVGGTPRLVGGAQQYHLDVYGPGSQRFAVSSTDGQVGMKLVATSTGNFFDAIRMDASGGSPAIAGVPLTIRLSDSAGTLYTAASLNPNKQIQIGEGINGSICSTQYSALGVYNGPLSFVTSQTIPVLPGSTITALTMTTGQIGRLLVYGGGSITLPATVKVPRGGAVYGTARTLIGFYCDAAGNLLATFTPYDV